ncbi:MAG: transglutaminase domain-containing protein [Clostridiales bacterium]|nr:transglutaminase domain-containing protein [Clostridiales bacterium]
MGTDINETNEAKQSKKGGKAAVIAAAVLLACCLIASLGLNVYQAYAQQQYAGKVGEFIDEQRDRWAEEEKQENEYIEDGFKVSGEYEIRSTTHISDAYKSGDDSQLSAEDKETLEMAEAVLDEIIEDGMNDYEKEFAVYKWLVDNIGHGSSGVISRPGMNRSAFTPHDVLTRKSAVCVGYATTFRLFMNMLGMDVHIVHNEYHSWDLVKLDGDWYHVDVYSDAHGTLYGNFNMTDDLCRSGHNWDESALPEANSVKYSPAVQNGVEVDDIYAVPALVKTSLDETEGGISAFYKFKTALSDEDMLAADFLVQTLRTAIDFMPDADCYMRASWFPGEGADYILGIFIERYGDSEEPGSFDPASAAGRQIIQAIAEAFELDPEMLGLTDDPGIEDVPVEVEVIGGADGPVQVITTETGASVIVD